jgi:hypothetical protein
MRRINGKTPTDMYGRSLKFPDPDQGFRTVASIFVVWFCIVITVISLCIFGVVKGCQHISEHGLKDTVEGIWEGPDDSDDVETNAVVAPKYSGQ